MQNNKCLHTNFKAPKTLLRLMSKNPHFLCNSHTIQDWYIWVNEKLNDIYNCYSQIVSM